MSDLVLPPVQHLFRAIALAVVPDAAKLDERGWEQVQGIVEGALASRPAKLRRQLRLFIRIINIFSFLRFGRSLPSIDVARRTRLLERFQDAPVLLLRKGFWGLRTMILMGYYCRDGVGAALGYRADRRGWEARA
jgi:hypothetical protein